MNTKLYLLRHAQRNNLDGDFENPGISQLGREQADKLGHLLLKKLTSPQPRFICSPKKRTVETIEIASSVVGRSFEINPALDERRAQESRASFSNRIQNFCFELAALNPPDEIILVSHQDWLEVFESIFISSPFHPWNLASGHLYKMSGAGSFSWVQSLEVL